MKVLVVRRDDLKKAVRCPRCGLTIIGTPITKYCPRCSKIGRG
jgi:uncharacterized C2H2 Zn-finger protein